MRSPDGLPRPKSVLVVRLSGQEYALDAAWVRGAMQLRGQTLHPIRSFGPFRHLVSIDGRMTAVASPHASLGLTAKPVSARSSLVLIQPPVAADSGGMHAPAQDSQPFALVVDSISRFEPLRAAHFRWEDLPEGPQPRVRLSEKWRPLLDLNGAFPSHLACQATLAFARR